MVVIPSGRPRRYCRRSHRQRAYEARRLAERMGLDRGEALISADVLARVRDRLSVLRAAVHDVERDLADAGDYRAAFRHLYRAAMDLTEVRLEPIAVLADVEG